MSMYRVFSCIFGRGCLLWQMCSLGKTLLAFALLHFVFKAKLTCYSRYLLTFYFCIPVPYDEKDIFCFFGVSSRRSWRRQWQPTPVLLPGKSYGRRSLIGCRPWGREELDTTERLHFHFSFSWIGEGNSNPLQYCCLENPRDGGAWWAAVYGVA